LEASLLKVLHMTPADFRRIALSMPGTEEIFNRGSRFRTGRRVFAALRGAGDSIATVYLTPDEQSDFVRAAPRSFMSVAGGMGRLGETYVFLATAEEKAVEAAIRAAWAKGRQ